MSQEPDGRGASEQPRDLLEIDDYRLAFDSFDGTAQVLDGVSLRLAVEVLDVRAGTDEEIEHEHPHGAGGHDHDGDDEDDGPGGSHVH